MEKLINPNFPHMALDGGTFTAPFEIFWKTGKEVVKFKFSFLGEFGYFQGAERSEASQRAGHPTGL